MFEVFVLRAYYMLVHVVNVHRCTLGFWKWFRWIQHPKIALFRHLKLVCSSIGSKVILRAYYVFVHAVNVHRCMLGFWKCLGWTSNEVHIYNLHAKKQLLMNDKWEYSTKKISSPEGGWRTVRDSGLNLYLMSVGQIWSWNLSSLISTRNNMI